MLDLKWENQVSEIVCYPANWSQGGGETKVINVFYGGFTYYRSMQYTMKYKCQCCPHIETSQLTCFCMRATLALNSGSELLLVYV